MSTRDSGIIDLFAIHNEEEARISAPAPSAPPPAVSFDTGAGDADDDIEVDALLASQLKVRKRTKIIGGAIGAVAVVGILIAAITSGGSSEPAKTATAAAAAPPPAVTAPPPPVVDPPPATPAREPAPPPTANANAKPDYTRASAVTAYAASQGKKKAPARKAVKTGGVKLQKVQSAGL